MSINVSRPLERFEAMLTDVFRATAAIVSWPLMADDSEERDETGRLQRIQERALSGWTDRAASAGDVLMTMVAGTSIESSVRRAVADVVDSVDMLATFLPDLTEPEFDHYYDGETFYRATATRVSVQRFEAVRALARGRRDRLRRLLGLLQSCQPEPLEMAERRASGGQGVAPLTHVPAEHLDGPAERFQFWSEGRASDFSRSQKRFRLLSELWSIAAGRPAPQRTVTEVMEAIYPGDNEADDGFEKLRQRTNAQLERDRLPLKVISRQGYIWIEHPA